MYIWTPRVITVAATMMKTSLQWRHNQHDGVSNHQPHDCLINRLFRSRSKKTSKLCVTSLCAGTSLVTGEFPTQRGSDAENVSIWWRHHAAAHSVGNKNDFATQVVSNAEPRCSHVVHLNNLGLLTLAWWRHQMEAFSALRALWSYGHRWIPRTKGQ